MQKYFDHLQTIGIKLEDEQKAWYIAREVTQKDDMRREYPSTPEESWEVSHEGLYYSKQMAIARGEKRIGFIHYDEYFRCIVLGIWAIMMLLLYGYSRFSAKEVRLIEYLEGSGESLAHWLGVLKSKD